MTNHVEVLRQMFAACANERRMMEADALDAAIAALLPSAADEPVAAINELGDALSVAFRHVSRTSHCKDWQLVNDVLLKYFDRPASARPSAGVDSASLNQIAPKPYPKPHPDTGADQGPCCAHAYADGWNDAVAHMTDAFPLVRAKFAALTPAAGVVGHMFPDELEALRRGEWPQDVFSEPSEAHCQMTGRVKHTVPLFAAPAPPPADAVRALVGRWLNEAAEMRSEGSGRLAEEREYCADELERALSAAPALDVTVPPGGTNWGAALGDAQKAAAAPTPEVPLPTADKVRRVIDIARGMGEWDGKTFNPELADAIRDLTQQEGGRHAPSLRVCTCLGDQQRKYCIDRYTCLRPEANRHDR